MSEVVRHVVASIGPASRKHAEAARARVAAAGAGVLERLAALLAGAQHTATPRADRRTLVVCAGDHGAGDPGISLGASHPTVIAAQAIASGSAALADVARASRTPIMLVDAGAVEAAAMPASTIRLGRGPTRDLLREPAMTVVDATLGLEAGIALAISLSEPGLDLLALGALGVGSELSAAAILGACAPFPLDDDRGAPHDLGTEPGYPLATAQGLLHEPIRTDARIAIRTSIRTAAETDSTRALDDGPRGDDVSRALDDDPRGDANDDVLHALDRGRALGAASGLEVLAAFGGPETAVLAGVILGAASLHVPVILDGHATGAAAMIAARLAPDVAGYLIAAHAGSTLHAAFLTELRLEPAFAVGLGHGEGIGAAMVLPLIDQVVALSTTR
jgi:nicotinate-nucleotide--dimethylbenzimidazole phosphoribosyltransferase